MIIHAVMRIDKTTSTFPPVLSRIGKRFCVTAAVPKENCGKHQTMFARMVAIAQPQPRTGLISLLIETNGLCPVESVTWFDGLIG